MIKYSLALVVAIFFTSCSVKSLEGEGSMDESFIHSIKKGNTSLNEKQVNEIDLLENNNSNKNPEHKVYKIPKFDNNYASTSNKLLYKSKSGDIPVFNNKNGKMKISVENIPINDFINVVFGKMLKLNYVVSQKVQKMKNKITLVMNDKIPEKEFFDLVNKILSQNSIRIEKGDNDIWNVTYQKSRKKIMPSYYIGNSIPSTLKDSDTVFMLIPLTYIKPSRMSSMLRKFDKKTRFYPNMLKNAIGIEDTVAHLKRELNFIRYLDKPSFGKKDIYMFHLEYIESSKFLSQITNILKIQNIPIAKNINDVGMVLLNIDSINSILVITDKKEWLDIVKFWMEKLDTAEHSSTEKKLYIYHVLNRKADELTEIINQISTQLKGVKNKKESKPDDTKIIADLPTNTIMIYTTPMKYKMILPIIKQLDKLPLQVLIQAEILDLTMTGNFSLGFEWFLSKNGYRVGTLGGLGIGGAGLTGSVIKSSLGFQSLVNAFIQNKTLKVLSQPRIVVLNNEQGTFNVGQRVPTVSSETSTDHSSNTPTILRNIKYANTGIILNVLPTVNSNGIVTLRISITLSAGQTNTLSNIDSPIIINRSITTSVVLNSNDTLLLGGLISNDKSKTDTSVPFLSKIPWIGNLFKSYSYSNDKHEMIILIKPTIINSMNNYNMETYKFYELLKYIPNLDN